MGHNCDIYVVFHIISKGHQKISKYSSTSEEPAIKI
jgi:hypothetical protein